MMLTTVQAQAVVGAAFKKAAQMNVAVNIAVLDAGGHLKTFLRMDGAILGSIEIAIKKAETAILFEINSEDAWRYYASSIPTPPPGLTDEAVPTVAGGVPLRRGGQVLGGVGISGAENSEDAEVAIAAAAAFIACH
jgi:uncharacterized protein GlcG (DUF336 family)